MGGATLPWEATGISGDKKNEAAVGGSALPGGVMMRTRSRVGIAVRREEDGVIVTDSFDVAPPKGRWARWPLMRGVFSIRSAVTTGQKAMSISERLRWEEVRPDGEAEAAAVEEDEQSLGFWGKVAIGVGAVIGAAIQIAAFRIGPIVIAKQAGLTGAAFIIADAAIRLGLLLGMLMFLSLLRPFRKILKYHGAEHKAIATHEAGHPLTAAAAAGFSRFHPRCGTSFLVVSALVSIVVYGAVLAITGVFTYPALIATRIIGAPIVTGIAFEIQRQASLHAHGKLEFLSWPGMWAQRLTTRSPEDEQLEVACAALAVALEEPDVVPENVHGEVIHPSRDAVSVGPAQPLS